VIKDSIAWLGPECDRRSFDAEAKSGQDQWPRHVLCRLVGQGQGRPASIGLAALVLSADTVLVLTHWGTPGEEEKNAAAIMGILNSIKPVE
jgi:hypothetical protein